MNQKELTCCWGGFLGLGIICYFILTVASAFEMPSPMLIWTALWVIVTLASGVAVKGVGGFAISEGLTFFYCLQWWNYVDETFLIDPYKPEFQNLAVNIIPFIGVLVPWYIGYLLRDKINEKREKKAAEKAQAVSAPEPAPATESVKTEAPAPEPKPKPEPKPEKPTPKPKPVAEPKAKPAEESDAAKELRQAEEERRQAEEERRRAEEARRLADDARRRAERAAKEMEDSLKRVQRAEEDLKKAQEQLEQLKKAQAEAKKRKN